jgi:hypothetical protein
MKPANRVRRIPIESDRGSEPTVTADQPRMIERLDGRQPPQTGVTVYSGRVTPVRRKTETLGGNASHCFASGPLYGTQICR